MRILKTIVATAVIVFALTTVAMAGVQHFTKQSGQATGTQAEAAQPTYTVTLTAAQLAQLMNGGKVATTRRAARPAGAASRQGGRATPPVTTPAMRRSASASGSGGSAGTHRYEATYRRQVPVAPVPAAITPRRAITPAVVTTADPAVTDQVTRSVQEPATARRLLRREGRLNPGRIGVALRSDP